MAIKKLFNLTNLTLIVALALSSVAAYYSIIGLTAIFAGAVIPVIIMGSILEVGKITTTVWLRKYWKRCGWVLKSYLVPAVVALALLTSMGIFGFLSKAHMEQGITTGDSQARLALYDEKIKTQRDNIELARKALTQMDNQVDQRLSRGDSENSAERAVAIRRQQASERAKLQKEIGEAQKEITKLNEERAPIAAENRKIEAEVGPIKYIAALIYGNNADQNMLESAVRWVIILLVIVFDPLAIALVLAANASREWDTELIDEEQPKESAVPNPITDDLEPEEEPLDNERIPEPEEDYGDCPKCSTPLVNAPGIGPYCPNKECDVLDGPLLYQPESDLEEQIEPVVEEEKTLAELHPYLFTPNTHTVPGVEPVGPMVYTLPKEETEPEVVTPEPGPEVSHEIVTSGVTKEKPYTDTGDGYVNYDGKSIQIDALKELHPELFMLTADSATQVSTNFGVHFPKTANKGDVFVRVDILPNRVYKFDGNKWIEMNKDISDSYLDDTYIQYLIAKLDSGEYDLELLSDKEKSQIESYLKNQST